MTQTKKSLVGTMLIGTLAMQGTIADTQGPSNKEVNTAEAILPFTVCIPDKDLSDFRRRIMETRWPDMETFTDASQGAKLSKQQGPSCLSLGYKKITAS